MESNIFMKKKKFAKLRTLNRKRNYMMKNIRYYSRLFIEKILWDKKSKSAIDFTAVKSILILRNEGKIGDVIVDSGLIKVLSQHGYDVDIIVTPDNCSIMQHDKHIRSIYVADKISLNDFMKKRNHNVSSDIIHQLNKNKYDLIIDPSIINTPTHRPKLLKEISAKNAIGFNKNKWINHYGKSISFDYDKNHIKESYKLLLSEFGITDISPDYEINYPDETGCDTDNYISSLPPKNINIVINMFAGTDERSLSLSQAKELDDRLNSLYDNITVIVLDYRNELSEKNFTYAHVYNPISLQHSIALISKSDLIISPDTSIVHISAAFRKNLIAIYKNDIHNNELWGPGYENAVQLFTSTSRIYDDSNIINEIISSAEKKLKAYNK